MNQMISRRIIINSPFVKPLGAVWPAASPRVMMFHNVSAPLHKQETPKELRAKHILYTEGLKYPLKEVPTSPFPSGFTPPVGGTDNLPFRVIRTKNGSLPVYSDFKNGRTKRVTILRKFTGDIQVIPPPQT